MTEQLWGGETTKAVDNFPVSGERIPPPVVHWLGRLKAAAARVNAELGGLEPRLPERIASAGEEVAAGEHDEQFPIDVFQTGSGTLSNMNANEVIANLAGEGVHPNDGVNMGQSSNDVFPSAVHLAALDEAKRDLLPSMDGARLRPRGKGGAVRRRGQGRPHPPDGRRPGHPRAGVRRLRRPGPAGRAADRGNAPSCRPDPVGGTATGTGLNTHPEFAAGVRRRLAEESGLEISEPLDRFEAQANRDALVELSGRSRSTPSRSTRSPTTWR